VVQVVDPPGTTREGNKEVNIRTWIALEGGEKGITFNRVREPSPCIGRIYLRRAKEVLLYLMAKSHLWQLEVTSP
jgi:hypothetical protein